MTAFSECPSCGSSDVMDDGRGWYFCNDCPWGDDPRPPAAPEPVTPTPGEPCRATMHTNPDRPTTGEVVECGRRGPHDGVGPFTMHRTAGGHWHWEDGSRGSLTNAAGTSIRSEAAS